MPARKRHRLPAASLLLLALWCTASCEQAFEPLQENDRYAFSIYGYLDASADTQWVRVAPVRESLTLLPETVEATVTVEHLGSGTMAILHDSLFQFFHGVHAYNFWTTMDLQPQETYRLTAEGSDGKASRVTVTLPDDFPTPRVQLDVGGRDYVYIEGIERLADVQTIYHVRHAPSGSEYVYAFPHIHDASPTVSGYQVSINPGPDQGQIVDRLGPNVQVINRQIFVASAGPGWQDFRTLDEEVFTLPDGVSNVEDGVGYLAGIVSKTIPYESCLDEDGDLVGCPLD